ncbi:hypothetical protein VSDG_07586 [Cytospora chrysosperma]|uniref:Uncharacterized protein n=1 Tax=Cytospora chrysosperma TaxID=252740 RepID=A0A423VLT6_CYTCH|nr:hypothetical protein VSDG_07586 [Valsa sordida]
MAWRPCGKKEHDESRLTTCPMASLLPDLGPMSILLSAGQARDHPPLVVRRTNLKESAHFGPRIRGSKHSSLGHRGQIRQISSGMPSVAAEISAVVMGGGLARREG